MRCRTQPCETCPYRRDVPSGVWAAEEYAKLPEYDKPTGDQPPFAFFCHTSPNFLCTGWAVVHGKNPKRGYELLSLRLAASLGHPLEKILATTVPLFKSGAAAAKHGLKDIDHPSLRARRAVRKVETARKRKAGK